MPPLGLSASRESGSSAPDDMATTLRWEVKKRREGPDRGAMTAERSVPRARRRCADERGADTLFVCERHDAQTQRRSGNRSDADHATETDASAMPTAEQSRQCHNDPRDDDLVDSVIGRLRARRQQRRHVPADEDGRGGLAGDHGALLQPHGLRIVAGTVVERRRLRDVVRGIDERGVLGQVDAVLSGYQGRRGVGAMILEAVSLVKSRNPAAIYCCDPVLGDADRRQLRPPGIPELMRDTVVPAAQIITPNQFELTSLTGLPVSTMEEVLTAADAARALGPEVVLITSVVRARCRARDHRHGCGRCGDGAWLVSTPRLPRTFTGSGDITAAIFLATVLRGWTLPRVLAHTAAVIYGVLEVTNDSGSYRAAADCRSGRARSVRVITSSRYVCASAASCTTFAKRALGAGPDSVSEDLDVRAQAH